MTEVISQLVESLAWPVAAFAIAWLVRHEVRAAIGRVEKARLPGGTEFAFGQAPADSIPKRRPRTADNEASNVKTAEWDKFANIYWLGSDLMWTVSTLLRGGPTISVSHGLKQTLHHLKETGLDSTPAGEAIRGIYELVCTSEALLPRDRTRMASRLTELAYELGGIADANQPGYKPGPR